MLRCEESAQVRTGLAVTVLLVEELIQIQCGVAVIDCRRELQSSHHSAARSILLADGGVFLLPVVNGRIEIQVVVGFVGGQSVTKHCGPFHSDGMIIGDHAAEESDVCSVLEADVIAGFRADLAQVQTATSLLLFLCTGFIRQ